MKISRSFIVEIIEIASEDYEIDNSQNGFTIIITNATITTTTTATIIIVVVAVEEHQKKNYCNYGEKICSFNLYYPSSCSFQNLFLIKSMFISTLKVFLLKNLKQVYY